MYFEFIYTSKNKRKIHLYYKKLCLTTIINYLYHMINLKYFKNLYLGKFCFVCVRIDQIKTIIFIHVYGSVYMRID
jgi:hypothetical protein